MKIYDLTGALLVALAVFWSVLFILLLKKATVCAESFTYFFHVYQLSSAVHRAGSNGSMSASGSASPGFDPWRGRKFSFDSTSELGGVEMYTF